MAVVRVCVMQQRELESLLALSNGVHTLARASGKVLSCDHLRKVLLSSDSSVGFPFPACNQLALRTLHALLQARHANVLGALERTTTAVPSAGIASYRLECAREYCMGQVAIFAHAVTQVAAMLASRPAPALVRTPALPLPWLTEIQWFCAAPRCSAATVAAKVALASQPWIAQSNLEAGASIAQLRLEDVLCTLGMYGWCLSS